MKTTRSQNRRRVLSRAGLKSEQTFGCVSSIGLSVVSRERMKCMSGKKQKGLWAGKRGENDRAGWKNERRHWSGVLIGHRDVFVA